jgi:hypothetical protein
MVAVLGSDSAEPADVTVPTAMTSDHDTTRAKLAGATLARLTPVSTTSIVNAVRAKVLAVINEVRLIVALSG